MLDVRLSRMTSVVDVEFSIAYWEFYWLVPIVYNYSKQSYLLQTAKKYVASEVLINKDNKKSCFVLSYLQNPRRQVKRETDSVK